MKKIIALILAILIPTSAFAANYVVEYYHCDSQGTPVAVSDDSNQGKVLWKSKSLPFGESFTGTGATDSEIKYTGKIYNSELDLYDFGGRYYDASVGRFTGVDPVMGSIDEPQRLNSYAYCLNSPYKYVDPDGKCAVLEIAVAGAMIYGLAIVGYIATHHGQAPDVSFANPFEKHVSYEEQQAQTSGVAGGAPTDPKNNGDKNNKDSKKGRYTKKGTPREPASKYWEKQVGREDLSDSNVERINNGQSPIVDDQYVGTHPETEPFKGETIELHHENYGPNLSEKPTTLHRGKGYYNINHKP